jgi:hypothetical protein
MLYVLHRNQDWGERLRGSRYRGNLNPGIDAERIYSRLPIETTGAIYHVQPGLSPFMNDYVIMQYHSPKKESIHMDGGKGRIESCALYEARIIESFVSLL